MEDLSSYVTLLDEVNKMLEYQPDNEELLTQKQNIEELLTLSTQTQELSWKVGDGCQALWSEDNYYYNAVIVAIFIDGTCKVQFDRHDTKIVCNLNSLKPKMDENKHANKIRQRKRQQRKEIFLESQENNKKAKLDHLAEVNKVCEAERKSWKVFQTKFKKKEKKLASMKKETK